MRRLRRARHRATRSSPHFPRRRRTLERTAVGRPVDRRARAETTSPADGGDVLLARLSDALVVQAFRFHMQQRRSAGGWRPP